MRRRILPAGPGSPPPSAGPPLRAQKRLATSPARRRSAPTRRRASRLRAMPVKRPVDEAEVASTAQSDRRGGTEAIEHFHHGSGGGWLLGKRARELLQFPNSVGGGRDAASADLPDISLCAPRGFR